MGVLKVRDYPSGQWVDAVPHVDGKPATAHIRDYPSGVWIPRVPWDALNDDGTAWQPFDADSVWRTPYGGATTVRSNSDAITAFMAADAPEGCYTLTEDDYGTAMYWAKPTDPVYSIQIVGGATLPTEFAALRMPANAQPAPGTDGQIVVFDMGQQFVCTIWRATYDPDTNVWSAQGGSCFHFDGNGVSAGSFGGDPRNGGFRGQPGSIVGIRRQEIDDGVIPHVVRGSFSHCQNTFVYPMDGTDGSSTSPDAPPQGSIFRIKPSVDITTRGLSPEGLIVARALQDYGLIAADSNGSTHVGIPMEPCIREGRGPMWSIGERELQAFPWSDWEVMEPAH